MGNLKPNTSIIYESPDGGDTVYARYAGESERWLVGQSSKAKEKVEAIKENQLWHDIRTAAKTNPSLQKVLDRAIMIYQTVKDHDR